MSKAKYPNRDALNQALDYYLDAMFQFISECLDEQSIREALRLQSSDNLREKMEVKDIADLIKMRWLKSFKEKFKIIDREYIRYYDARSVTSLIIDGRNQVSHQRLRELDTEFTRAQLFFIVDILGKIKRPDAQREVEVIRDELFNDTTEQLVTIRVEDEKAKYEKSIAEMEKRLASAEKNKKKLSKQIVDNAVKLDEKTEELEKRSEQLVSAKLSKQECEKQRDSISKQLKKVQTAHSRCEERITAISNQLTTAEIERDNYKERFETVSRKREEAETEWQACEESLTAMRKLFTVATIGNQTVQLVYPPIETDAAVRILDRRGVDKKNYLLNLLEQKQPVIIYVQSEDKIKQLSKLVGPEKAGVIGEHNGRTSEEEEREILEKLENGEKIAVVSDTEFSTLTSAHCVEHFVFCHLVPGLDEFFRQCAPAFASEKHAYLHLIYDSEQDVKGLDQKYPDRKTLEKFYSELRKLAETNGDLIRPESVYNELGLAKPGIETGLAIFEELQLLERSDEGVKLLPPAGKKLDASEIYRRGEQLKSEAADFQVFQFEQSIEQIWEALLKELNVDNENILEASSVYEVRAFQDAIEDSRTQPEPSTDAVENDSKSDAEVSEAQSEPSTDTVEDDNTVDNEDAETKPTRANAKVTEEQVREIRSRSAAGESNSELAEGDRKKKPEVKHSEFWQPIRDGEFGALFAGKPVRVRDDGWISKRIRGVEIILSFRKNRSYVSFLCTGENRIERRDKIIAFFPEADYNYSPHESPQRAGFRFPVINKGKDHPEDWDEIRKKLVAMGTDIYNKIDESDL